MITKLTVFTPRTEVESENFLLSFPLKTKEEEEEEEEGGGGG